MIDRERLGALCWVLTAQFFVAQAVPQSAMAFYDPIRWDISLLGITECGVFFDATSGSSDLICSPLHYLFNIGIVLHGLLALAGIWLTRNRWVGSKRGVLALVCLALGCIGAIIVGLYPLNLETGMHSLGAILALTFPGIALVVLSTVLFAQRPLFAAVSLVCGLCILGGAIGHAFGGPVLGRGTVERLAAWPQTIWYMIAGTAMLVGTSDKPARNRVLPIV